MIERRWYLPLILISAIIAGCGGCGGGDTSTNAKNEEAKKDDDTKKDGEEEEDGEFVLGDLVDDFDPPTLEELDAKVEWIDRGVVTTDELLEARKEWIGPPQVTVAEALAMRNTSPKANRQILSTLGQAPKDDDAVDWNATWVRHTAADVKSTNPLMISSSAEFDIQGGIGWGLFGFDWNFEPFASASSCLSWHTSKDGMYDKVVMRSDQTWSDGKPITAHDVEFSFKVIMSKKVPVPAVRSGTDKLKYVKAYDDQTLVYFHKEPLATNVWNVNFPVIPKHVYENTIADDPTLEKSEAHVEADRNPVTGGSYVITKRERGQEIVLERRESYYMFDGKQVRDKPHFKEIRFKIIQDPSTSLLALKKGDIEEMTITPQQWQNQTNGNEFYENNTKVYDVEWTYFYFGWNCKTPYFDDKRVRWAMGYAFNHDELLKKHRYGLDEAATGIFHPASKWAPKNPSKPIKQDLDKAEELLAEAGWEDTDGDGILDKEVNGKRIPFDFTIITSNRQDRIDMCNLLKENLDSIGIVCNVRSMEYTVLQDRSRKHKFHAMFAGWGTGTDPDTSDNIWATKAIDQGRNYVQYSNKEVDDLFEQGKRELDPEKRKEIYGKIHEILWEDQPYTWLFFRNAYFGFSKKLRGYYVSPRGPYSYGPGEGTIYKPAMK